MSLIEAVFTAVTDPRSGFHTPCFCHRSGGMFAGLTGFRQANRPGLLCLLKQIRSSLLRVGVSWAHKCPLGRVTLLPPPPPNEAARLMHSCVNFQGQVLHLTQRDTRLFNYVDSLIAYVAKRPRRGSLKGSAWIRGAWSRCEPGFGTKGPISVLLMAIEVSQTVCFTVFIYIW